MTATLVQFPGFDISDVPRGLRSLADSIEAGKFDDAHNVVWIIDCGAGRIELGMLGASPSAGAVTHLLLGVAMRKMEDSCSAR